MSTSSVTAPTTRSDRTARSLISVGVGQALGIWLWRRRAACREAGNGRSHRSGGTDPTCHRHEQRPANMLRNEAPAKTYARRQPPRPIRQGSLMASNTPMGTLVPSRAPAVCSAEPDAPQEQSHRVHDLTYGLLFTTTVVGVIVQARRPAGNVAGMLMALTPGRGARARRGRIWRRRCADDEPFALRRGSDRDRRAPPPDGWRLTAWITGFPPSSPRGSPHVSTRRPIRASATLGWAAVA